MSAAESTMPATPTGPDSTHSNTLDDSTTLLSSSSDPTSQTGSGMTETPDKRLQDALRESSPEEKEMRLDPSMMEGGEKERREDEESAMVVDAGAATGQRLEDASREEGEIGPHPFSGDSANGDTEMVPLESTQSSSSDPSETGDDNVDWLSDSDRESKRVKVYELVGSEWVDQGTAFCMGMFKDDSPEAFLVARSEKDLSHIVLTSEIKSTEVYQRQQNTLIVWTEPDGVDYALSFQDPDGCTEVWNFITEVQKHMNTELAVSSPALDSMEEYQSDKFTVMTLVRNGQLPPPALGMIDQVELAIRQLGRTQTTREKISEYILNEDYVRQLISVFFIAEDLEDLDNLHAICGLMQTILMLNDHNLYDHILEDELFTGVLGMLEYDPEFPTHKGNFRDFIRLAVHFHDPVKIKDELISRKVHQTYRLQFLKDVVLARSMDDSTFNILNSCIIFNQIDIIAHVQGDPSFLKRVVRLFVPDDIIASLNETPIPGNNLKLQNGIPFPKQGDDTSEAEKAADTSSSDATATDEVSQRKEVLLLIQQLCIMGKNIQLPTRLTLFRTLVERGILFLVQWSLGLPLEYSSSAEASIPQPITHANINIINAGGEILSSALDHDLLGVRQFVLRQVGLIDKGNIKSPFGTESLLLMLCRILTESRDLSVQSLVGDCLKMWLEMAIDTPGGASGEMAGRLQTGGKKDEPSNERFLDYFYKTCVAVLMKPLNDLAAWNEPAAETATRLTREETNRFLYLCDILHSMLAQHHFRSYLYVISSNIMVRVASLLRARDKHLRHAAFRFFRLLVRMNNITLRSQMIKHDVLHPILDLTIRESKRDNLLSCSCQEFFEIIRRDNFKDLIAFCMVRHQEKIDQLAESPLGADRFKMFIQRHKINIEPPPPMEAQVEQPDSRWQRQVGVEKAEEDYFLGDDTEDDYVVPISQQPISGIATSNGVKRKRGSLPPLTGSPSLRSSGLQPKPIAPVRSPLESLSDYTDEEDEAGEDEKSKVDALFSVTRNGSSETVGQIKDQIRSLFSPKTRGSAPSSAPSGSSTDSTLRLPPRRPEHEEEDDEDNLLESLVRSKPKPTVRRISGTTLTQAPKSGGKRRREEDDDDEMERAAKRADLGSHTTKEKEGDDPPKKFQVKLGSFGKEAASSSTKPESHTTSHGVKDGDTG